MNGDSLPLCSALASDPELQEIVRLFVEEMPERMSVFEKHLASGNWGELARAAHQLKGAAGSHGFAKLSSAAAELESTIKSEADRKTIADATAALAALCRRVSSLPAPVLE